MSMNLENLRQEIDILDSQLLALLQQRMQITAQVAEYKIANGLPVLNAAREQEILDRVAASSRLYGDGMKLVFSSIMDVSRANQHRLLGDGALLKETLAGARQMDFEAFDGTVACPGVPGAYTSEAAAKMFPCGELEYFTGFEDVFQAVSDGRAAYGVVPVENSTSGSVHETYDLIMKYRFSIVRGYDLPISHCLCALPGVQAEEIQDVYSKAEALAQCSDYLKAHRLNPVPYSNTAAAAKYLHDSGVTDSGAICSAHAARFYGLAVLDDQIQINTENTTRFIVISRDLILNEDADKISLIITLPHVTGSLYQVLGQFSMCGLNLTKLESRPNRTSEFEYHFYLDLAGNVKNEATRQLLCTLSADLPGFSLIGNYKEDLS